MRSRFLLASLVGLLLAMPACIKVQVEPPDKPIHVVMDVNINIRIDRQLDNFFSFENELNKPTTQPTVQP